VVIIEQAHRNRRGGAYPACTMFVRRSALTHRTRMKLMFHHSKPFSGFSVNDLKKAKKFYQDTLGLEVSDAPMGALELSIDDDTKVLVYESRTTAPRRLRA
jgi:catechol-2,3-dioxygenase